jgi:hypothetical protein
MKNLVKRAMRGLSWACAHNDCFGCPGASCSCRCHR